MELRLQVKQIFDLTIESVDNDGLRINGQATLSDVVLMTPLEAFASSGTVALTDADFTQTGTGVSLTGGAQILRI